MLKIGALYNPAEPLDIWTGDISTYEYVGKLLPDEFFTVVSIKEEVNGARKYIHYLILTQNGIFATQSYSNFEYFAEKVTQC